jgi:hypothetical protein
MLQIVPPSRDCNDNLIPDDCDIAEGTSVDLDVNGVPDECDPDCNDNDIPDCLDLAGATSADCNDNDIPDECDIAAGASSDCQSNGTPDECELPYVFQASSGYLTPLVDVVPQSFTIPSPPPADSDVLLTLTVAARLNDASDYVEVNVNGVYLGQAFGPDGHYCPEVPDVAEIIVPSATFNGAVGGGDAVIEITTTTPYGCVPSRPSDSYAKVTVEYEVDRGFDCNANAVPDECDLLFGESTDCNSNDVPDECELPGSGDSNGDGQVNLTDFAVLADCLTGPCAGGVCDPPLYSNGCCALVDMDGDGDADLTDVGLFQTEFGGP